MKKILTLLLSLPLVFTSIPSSAMQGGDEAIGSPDVVALLTDRYSTRSICSAALVTNMIVATAAHCVTALNSDLGELSRPESAFFISSAGEDLGSASGSARYQVSKIFRTPGYVNIWKPSQGDTRTQKDDIAFLVLEKPVEGRNAIPLITREELLMIKSEGLTITHVGYGYRGINDIDGKPYKIQLVANSLGSSRYSNNAALETHTLTSDETGTKALCPGDSGSPWYVTIEGIKKLAGVTVGGSGCGGSGVNGALGTSASEYASIYALAEAAAMVNVKKLQLQNFKLSAKTYKTCKLMNKVLPGGIAKTLKAAKSNTTKHPPFISSSGYIKNFRLDHDKDGVVCEK